MPNSLVIRSGECKKFSPNIFNKTKCTNCFRQKEEHSAEALESNRATRKVAKCGYLFVAPGWDFTNPVNRTKRWQRRWFVLYDDGELSYSVDEHPETVPQACIDMNKVVDVSDAEELTGNPHSIAITTHDGAHFVKATCREEAKWWMDVLSVFPRSKSRHKRTTTYSVVTKNLQSSNSANALINAQSNINVKSNSRQGINSAPVKEICSRYVWTTEDNLQSCSSLDNDVTPSPITRKAYLEVQQSAPSRMCSDVCLDDKSRNRWLEIREKPRILKSATSAFNEDDVTKILPNWHDGKSNDVSRRLLIEDFDKECKMKDVLVTDSVTRPHSRHSSSSFSSTQDSVRDMDISSHKQIRGDPDGCGLDLSTLRYSPSSEMRTEAISEDLLNTKKGWLMKQGQDQEWHKHWFVLRGSALLYYRDPTAEDQGILDGVIDLSVMNNVNEVQVARNYGFQIASWDEKRYVLSAVTAGIRSNWIASIKRAAGIQDDASSVNDTDKEIPSTPRSMLLSSDEEYRTASENGRRESSSDWGETLPPSPPLNRTPISRVKERARGVTRTRIYNSRNSKSSPPSSRRSTLDSVRHDVLTPCVEVNIQEKSDRSLPLSKKLEKQAIELEDVKRQLTGALRQLSSAEEELLRLRQRQQDVVTLEKQMTEMMQALKRAEDSLKQKSCDLSDYESLKKRYSSEKSAWDEELRVTECELHETEERYSVLCCELASSREHVEQLRSELADVNERLARGIEENESLYRRLRELEGRSIPISSSVRESKGRSLDSLSDLTNIDFDLDVSRLDKDRIIDEYEDVKVRFEKAVLEIKAMKKELKESHAQTDCLEISLINARQELKSKQEFYESQATMMGARIEDLTAKLFSAEKQIRSLKQKLSKTENREKKRSLSLKGRESYAMCKELEEKLSILERKISLLNGESTNDDVKYVPATNNTTTSDNPTSIDNEKTVTKLRRKSLDSATSANPEPMKILIRMNSLESKVAEATNKNAVITIKQSPSVANDNINDDIDSSFVSLGYNNNNNYNNDNTEINSERSSVILNEMRNMEKLLKTKLTEIYGRQASLKNAGRLTNEVRLNLMAEKLAYESVLICRLHEIVTSGSNDTDGRLLVDAERLIDELDDKLRNYDKRFIDKSNSFDYHVNSLSRYLVEIGKTVDRYLIKNSSSTNNNNNNNNNNNVNNNKRKTSGIMTKNLRKKKLILDRKVNQFLTDNANELSTVLLSTSSSSSSSSENNLTELVRETVNGKLIQTEISQIMSHYCSDICRREGNESSLIDRADLEEWADKAICSLNEQLDNAVRLVKSKCRDNKFVQSRQKNVNSGNDNEAKTLLLRQFVDIVAHKCLLDARLSMLVVEEYLEINDNESNELVREQERVASNDDSVYDISTLDEAAIMSEVQFLYAKLHCDLQNGNDEKRVFDSLESVGTEVFALCSSVEDLFRKRSFYENNNSNSSWHDEWKEHNNKYEDSVSSSESSSWLEGVCKRCTEIKEQIINLQTCLSQNQDCCQKCLYLQEQLHRKEDDYEIEKSQLEKQHYESLKTLQTDFENEKKSLVSKYEHEERILREKSRKLEKRLDALDSEYMQQIDNLRNSYDNNRSTSIEMTYQCDEESIRHRYQTEIEQLRALCEKGLAAMDSSHRRIIAELEEKHRQEIEALKLEKEQALAEETQATLAALDAMRKAHEAEVQKEIAKFKNEYFKKVQSTHDIGALHKEHEAEMEEIKREILSLSEKYSVKCVESAALEEKLLAANSQLAQAQHHILQLDSRNKQLRAHIISEMGDDVINSELNQRLDEKSKEISELRNQLIMHDDTLNLLCTHLSNGQFDRAIINPLLEKLKSILVTASKHRSELTSTKKYRKPVHRTPSTCALSGMVAERKKIFES